MLSKFRKLPILLRFSILYLILLWIVPLFLSPEIEAMITIGIRIIIASGITYISQVAIKQVKPFEPSIRAESSILDVNPAILQSGLVDGESQFEIIISSEGMKVITE